MEDVTWTVDINKGFWCLDHSGKFGKTRVTHSLGTCVEKRDSMAYKSDPVCYIALTKNSMFAFYSVYEPIYI